jgi:hypothetical protein
MKYQLDLHLECLRQAFNTCYYCAAVFDYPEELERRCVKHVRRANEKGRPGRSGPSFPFLDVRPHSKQSSTTPEPSTTRSASW